MQAILDWISVNAAYASVIVFLISFLESLALVGILVPGMAIILGIGTLVGLGVIPLWPTMIWAALGAITGDGVSYWLGRHYNQRLYHMWPLSRHPKLIPKGVQFFHKHGELSILFGRFIGPLRAIVPAVAGMMDMSPARFYVMNIISAIAWAPVVIIPGAVFGASSQVVSDVALRLLLLVFALILLLWFLVWAFHRILRFCLDLVQQRIQIPTRQSIFFAYMLLIIMVISAPLLILTEKSAEIPADFAENQWRDNNWRVLAQANPQYNVFYSGNLSVIRHLRLQKDWYYPTALKTQNALQWLAPNSVLKDLPLYVGDLNESGGGWLMSFVDENKKTIYIVSIKMDEGRCLGFGRIQKLTYQPVIFGLGIPEVTLVTKIPASIVADISALDGLELTLRQHNNSELLTIRSTETVECDIKSYLSESPM